MSQFLSSRCCSMNMVLHNGAAQILINKTETVYIVLTNSAVSCLKRYTKICSQSRVSTNHYRCCQLCYGQRLVIPKLRTFQDVTKTLGNQHDAAARKIRNKYLRSALHSRQEELRSYYYCDYMNGYMVHYYLARAKMIMVISRAALYCTKETIKAVAYHVTDKNKSTKVTT